MKLNIRTQLLFIFIFFIGVVNNFAQDCSGDLSVILDGADSGVPLEVNSTIDPVTCNSNDGGITLLTTGGNPSFQYTWLDTLDNSSTRTNLDQGNYFVTVTDNEGCTEVMAFNIDLLSPTNTEIAMSDGCGNCSIADGDNDFFFNDNSEYIASIADNSTNSNILGETEVCLRRTDTVEDCTGNYFLQRNWSVYPTGNELACLKLYFTATELTNLATALGSPLTPQQLVDQNLICLTAYQGGNENCTDFQSAFTFTSGDTPPLELTEEDPVKGIWSVNVCTNEPSSYYLHFCSQVLPVELLHFTGNRTQDGNLLNWVTLSESNVSHFEIEKLSEDGNFTFIGNVDAIGQSTNIQNYNFLHTDPEELEYYRLKIVDLDGSIEYSEIIIVNAPQETDFKIFPSLFRNEITLEFHLKQKDKVELVLYDAIGQIAFKQNAELDQGNHQLKFQLEHLPVGNYFLHLNTDVRNVFKTFKITKI